MECVDRYRHVRGARHERDIVGNVIDPIRADAIGCDEDRHRVVKRFGRKLWILFRAVNELES